MSRDIFPQPRVLRAPSNLALNPARAGAEVAGSKSKAPSEDAAALCEGCSDPGAVWLPYDSWSGSWIFVRGTRGDVRCGARGAQAHPFCSTLCYTQRMVLSEMELWNK